MPGEEAASMALLLAFPFLSFFLWSFLSVSALHFRLLAYCFRLSKLVGSRGHLFLDLHNNQATQAISP